MVASASAMMAWILFDVARNRRPSALGACIGAVVGLVAITPAAGYVSIPHSLFIGFVASIISNQAVHWKSKSNLDDTLDVFPCHGVGGIVGMILTGVLAKDVGLFWGPTKTFTYHMIALVIVGAFSFLGSLVIYKLTDFLLPMRVTPEQEAIGLDLSQHGEFMELEPARQFGYTE
jgi:Amt family ammonium transporter